MHTPIILKNGSYTDAQRTPWAGDFISRHIKDSLAPEQIGAFIGESWEFSCDPDYLSCREDSNSPITDTLRADPEAMLSADLCAAFVREQQPPSFEILVKLLNARLPLSVQVHPDDHNPNLALHECGKPESWLVLDAKPGAGLYLGFSKSIDPKALRAALKAGEDISALLQFVPVKPNDYFEITPGVCHAVGPGITLLEPQRVLSGKSGKTYRVWDWNRRYNAAGGIDPTGKARELHIEQSLAIIDFKNQVGEDFVNSVRKHGTLLELASGARVLAFPTNPYYQTQRLTMKAKSQCQLSLQQGYGVFTLLKGTLQFTISNRQQVTLKKGQTALLPFASFPLLFSALDDCDGTLVMPAAASYHWK